MVTFADGARWPALGLGTWRYGEAARRRRAEVRAVRAALDLGYRVFDTAEMYGEGGAESVLGEALQASLRAGDVARGDVFIVTKVYPHNAGGRAMRSACEASLRRLNIERVDLYLLHWRGNVPLAETIAAFEDLVQRGHIARWGVSNFDLDDMEELAGVRGGSACAANQVYYSLGQRGAGHALLPWLQRHGLPLMAYCPIDQGVLAANARLAELAARKGASAAQLALAWAMQQGGVMAIPKAVREAHLRENFAAAAITLAPEDLAALDAIFPPPRRKTALAMV